MSQYLCPDCGEDTKVTDTRPSYSRLRRRRVCSDKSHKFSTVEVPLDAPEKIVELIQFAVESVRDATGDMSLDMIAYARAQAREILLGQLDQDNP